VIGLTVASLFAVAYFVVAAFTAAGGVSMIMPHRPKCLWLPSSPILEADTDPDLGSLMQRKWSISTRAIRTRNVPSY